MSINYQQLYRDARTAPIFNTLTRQLRPTNVEEMLQWAHELYSRHGTYKAAIAKAGRYFMTKVEITGDELTGKERKNYETTLSENFHLTDELALICDDYIAFGNSFTTLHIPFQRSLRCTKCYSSFTIQNNAGSYRYNNGRFYGKCLNERCGKPTAFEVVDTVLSDSKLKPVITRWPPQYVRLKQHPISGRKIVSIDLSKYDWLVEGIKSGDPLYLEDTPLEVLEAVAKGKPLELDAERVFHMTSPTTAYSSPMLKGWGEPLFMSEFEDALLILMLDRYNEAIITDYLVPFRVVSPPPTAGPMDANGGDSMLTFNLGDFKSQAQTMLEAHRRNPTGWNFFPFPLEYQVLGGEAKNLVPVDLMQYAETRLLTSMGIPQEFYQTSLNSAGPIIGFRMFERFWQHLVSQLNTWLTWLVRQQGQLLQWKKINASLIPVSVYEDPADKQLVMDLSAAGRISNTTAFRMLNKDYEYEQNRIMEEQLEQEERMQEQQKRMQERAENQEAMSMPSAGAQLMMAQQPPAGAPPGAPMPAGMPPAGGPTSGPTGATLDDMVLQAQQQAQELWNQDPLTRRRTLTTLKHQNEAMYYQVKGELDKLEQNAKTQGVQASRAGQLPM